MDLRLGYFSQSARVPLHPIQPSWLASSKILTPHPPHCLASVYLPPLVRGEDILARRRGGWGVNILEDVRRSSVLYVCKSFVLYTQLYVPQSAYIGRDETGSVYLPTQLERTLQLYW